jgi:CheY-like chemotaxis protein
VLVVEDNQICQMVLQKQLQWLRVRFKITSSAEEAVRIYSKSPTPIPVILMDVEVDGPINGLQATSYIRKAERLRLMGEHRRSSSEGGEHRRGSPEGGEHRRSSSGGGDLLGSFSSQPLGGSIEEEQEPFPEQAFIAIMTGRALEEDRQEAFQAGCDDFLLKPINPEKIRELVQRQLQAHSLEGRTRFSP